MRATRRCLAPLVRERRRDGAEASTTEGEARAPQAVRDGPLDGALPLVELGGRERLVTDAQSWSQSVSRAFATELVAPVAWLRERVESDVIGEDMLHELAIEVGAPPRAVQHQLENHDIARVE